MRLANDKYKFAPELMWLTGAGHIAGRSWHTKPPAMDAERAAARAGLLARGEPSVLVMQALAAVGNPQPVATVGDTSIYPDGSLWDRRRREIWHDTHDYCSCLRALDVRDTENYSRMRAYLCFRRGKDDKSAAEAASSIPLAELEQMGLSVVKQIGRAHV